LLPNLLIDDAQVQTLREAGCKLPEEEPEDTATDAQPEDFDFAGQADDGDASAEDLNFGGPQPDLDAKPEDFDFDKG